MRRGWAVDSVDAKAAVVEVATPMGIRFICPNGHRLHVKSFLAGKRGICPHCDVRFAIPLADTGRVPAFSAAAPRPARGSRSTSPMTTAAEAEGASAVALDLEPLGNEPLSGGWTRPAALTQYAAKRQAKNLVLLLSLLVVLLAAVLVFVVLYFGDG